MRILIDGWALCRAPSSPAAIHSWGTVLALSDQAEVLIACPEEPPASLSDLPHHAVPYAARAAARLHWEQRALPMMARSWRADVLYGTGGLPLLGNLRRVHTPAPEWGEGPRGFYSRLQVSLGAGGTARAVSLPAGLDAPPPPPIPLSESLLPEPLPPEYVLYHAPPRGEPLVRALNAWFGWAARGIGGNFPLLLLGVDRLPPNLPDDWEETLIPYPAVPATLLPLVYHRAAALFHPAPGEPWGSPMRLAMAWGIPVVGLEEPTTAALVGKAAFLAPADDERALAAALVTTVVESEVADALKLAGLRRVSEWDEAAFWNWLTHLGADS